MKRCRVQHRIKQPTGFSLLEILMATSILLASVVVLNQLVGVGNRNAIAAQDQTTAQMLCESVLNEVLAGALPLGPVDEEAFVDFPGWVYSIRVEPQQFSGLSKIEVEVNADGTEKSRNQHFSMVRLVHRSSIGSDSGSENLAGPPTTSGSQFGLQSEGRQP